MLDYLWILTITALGLVIGSFLGALTYRMPKGISITKGRSQCPRCHKKISWYDNIPLLSFFYLGGKCRNCRQKISWRYPLVEAATAIGFLGVFSLYGTSVYLLIIFSLLVAIFVVDFEHRIIPDELVFIGLATATLFFLLGKVDLWPNLLTGFLLADFLLLVHLVTSGRGMGLGDVKLALFLGTFFGWPKGVVWMFSSFLLGGLTGVILILLGRAKLKNKIAFGPFLVAGALITFVFGMQILTFFQ